MTSTIPARFNPFVPDVKMFLIDAPREVNVKLTMAGLKYGFRRWSHWTVEEPFLLQVHLRLALSTH